MTAVNQTENPAEVVAKLRAELAETKGELASLRDEARRKEAFLGTLAHELRNPLAPICTSLEILRIAGDQAEIRNTHRAIIDRQTQRMVRLIDDLIDVAHSSRGEIQIHPEKIELGAVIANAVETIQPMVKRFRHSLTVDLPEPRLVFEADPARMVQILQIVLDNACKYTDPEGRIHLEGKREEDDVLIRIRDDGIGIPTDQLPEIFEMFAQIQKTSEQSRGGLGISLSLAERLAALHGGSLSAHSDGPGHGSEFVIRIPIGPKE